MEREEIERGADLARGVVGSAQAVLDKVAEEPGRLRSSRPGDLRAAHARGRQRPLDGVCGVVVEPVVVLGRLPPVHDVRLVPDFPIPSLDLGAAVAAGTVGHPLVDQLAPLAVIAGRIGPAGGDIAALWRPVMLVGLGLLRQRLRHEADLHVRFQAALEVSVEDAVNDRPVVMGPPLCVLGVSVRRAPLQGRRAVPGGQQVVGPYENRLPAKGREVRQQCLTIHISVVWLVISEEPPGGTQLPSGPGRVERDRDGGLCCLPSPGTQRDRKRGRDRAGSESHDEYPS